MSFRKFSPFKRGTTAIPVEANEPEEIKLYTKGDQEPSAKVISWAVAMLKDQGADEQKLVAAFFSLLLAFDYSQKAKVMKILDRCGYKGIIEVGAGEAPAEVPGGSPSKPKCGIFRGLLSIGKKGKQYQQPRDLLSASDDRPPLIALDSPGSSPPLIAFDSPGSSDVASSSTAPQNTAVVELPPKEGRCTAAVSIAQVLYIVFEYSTEYVKSFWKQVCCHCGMAEEALQLVDSHNKATLTKVFWMVGCSKDVKKIGFGMLDYLSKQNDLLANILIEAEIYARSNRFQKAPYILEI